MTAANITLKVVLLSVVMGQAITFVKTILNGPYNYVKTVVDSATRTLGGMG